MELINPHPLWRKEEISDIPLTPEQYESFCHGYAPDWECRYAPLCLEDGWHYIYRSGWLLKKFRYHLCDDGIYHLAEHYTTEMEAGVNLLETVLRSSYYDRPIFREREQIQRR